MSTPSIDLSILAEYVGDDPAELQRFIDLGLASLADAMQPLEHALRVGDLGTLEASAHRAKSTARQLGAEGFGEACAQLEQLSRKKDPLAALPQAQYVCALWPALRSELAAALERYSAQR